MGRYLTLRQWGKCIRGCGLIYIYIYFTNVPAFSTDNAIDFTKRKMRKMEMILTPHYLKLNLEEVLLSWAARISSQ